MFPKADYEVREVEPFRAESAAGAYYQQASADGSRPGIFYVNTFNLKAQPKFGTETLSLHEASPGHHFQVSIQQELEGVPRFRRFGGDYTAYVEGWALYAESLGKELGLFTDPYQWFGRLNDEMLRAMRLVVDTGLHAQGLEPRAGDPVHARQLDAGRVGRRVGSRTLHRRGPDRRSATRSATCASRACDATRSSNSERSSTCKDFHREVLSDGAVPLDVLETENRSLDRGATLITRVVAHARHRPCRRVALASLVMAGCDAHEAQAAVDAAAPAQRWFSARRLEQTPTASRTTMRNDCSRSSTITSTQYLALHPLRATELGDHRFDDRFGDYASPSWMADSLGIEQESLEKLDAVDPRKLASASSSSRTTRSSASVN